MISPVWFNVPSSFQKIDVSTHYFTLTNTLTSIAKDQPKLPLLKFAKTTEDDS